MARESERVHCMKEEFMEMHEQGMSIGDIAQNANLSKTTVYRHLQEVADANGVTRESLLQVVRTPSESYYRKEEENFKVDVEQMMTTFKRVGEDLSNLISMLEEINEKEEEHARIEI